MTPEELQEQLRGYIAHLHHAKSRISTIEALISQIGKDEAARAGANPKLIEDLKQMSRLCQAAVEFVEEQIKQKLLEIRDIPATQGAAGNPPKMSPTTNRTDVSHGKDTTNEG